MTRGLVRKQIVRPRERFSCATCRGRLVEAVFVRGARAILERRRCVNGHETMRRVVVLRSAAA